MKLNKGMVFLLIAVFGGLSFFVSTLKRQPAPDWSDKTPPALDGIRAALKERLGVQCTNLGYKMSESIFRGKNTRLTCEADDVRLAGDGLGTFGREVAAVMVASAPPGTDVIEACVARTDTVAGVKITGEQRCFNVEDLPGDAG